MSQNGVLKGMAMGLIAGAAVSMVGQQMIGKNKRALKKKANKFATKIEDFIDDAAEMRMFK